MIEHNVVKRRAGRILLGTQHARRCGDERA